MTCCLRVQSQPAWRVDQTEVRLVAVNGFMADSWPVLAIVSLRCTDASLDAARTPGPAAVIPRTPLLERVRLLAAVSGRREISSDEVSIPSWTLDARGTS